MSTIKRIISGGQTGCWPKSRRAVDGRIADRYPLQETASQGYNKRTQLNIKDADGTLLYICIAVEVLSIKYPYSRAVHGVKLIKSIVQGVSLR